MTEAEFWEGLAELARLFGTQIDGPTLQAQWRQQRAGQSAESAESTPPAR